VTVVDEIVEIGAGMDFRSRGSVAILVIAGTSPSSSSASLSIKSLFSSSSNPLLNLNEISRDSDLLSEQKDSPYTPFTLIIPLAQFHLSRINII
jgi:hypothetical protein